jgi:TatD DNase family protein
MTTFIDSHCHLDMLPGWVEGLPPEEHDRNIDEAVARAREAGVRWILNPGVTWDDFPRVQALTERYSNVFVAAGIHPHDAETWTAGSYERLKEMARHSRVVAIGECGLDYYYDNAPREKQQEAFRDQIRLAKELDLPLIIHTRDAEADTMRLLEEEGATRGVFHCFTGSKELALAGIRRGFAISFSGVVTFKKSEALREVAREVPDDRFLIETDAPYLAPPPYRGKRNEPAYVVKIAETLAEVRGVSVEAVAERATRNTIQLFRLPVEL